MFWCCVNDEPEAELALPKLTSEQVLPVSTLSSKTGLVRSATAAISFETSADESSHFFTVAVNRLPGTSFGLDVSAVGRVCMVNAVSQNSLLAAWNETALQDDRPEQVVQQYDRLMALNDERPAKGKDVSEKLKSMYGHVSIVIQRPVIHKVTVAKNGLKDLGISIIDGHGFLVVSAVIDGGIISQHNAKVAFDDVIAVPTRIISVDGEYGNGFELLQLMEECGEVFDIETLRYV